MLQARSRHAAPCLIFAAKPPQTQNQQEDAGHIGYRAVFIVAAWAVELPGAGPVLARIAKATGALVLGFVTLPFDCEGSRRHAGRIPFRLLATPQWRSGSNSSIGLPSGSSI
jgi:hypothetical protein